MGLAVETIQLTKEFNGRSAVQDVNLRISEGSIHGIVGANGAGKSTLLRMIIGLFRPTSGQVRVFGHPLPFDAAALRQRIQYVGADGELYRSFRVQELIEYARLLYERWDAERMGRLIEALELPLNRPIRNLSTGTKMQLRLAIGLSTHPELLVLDEPTIGLDIVVKRQFLQLIVQEAAQDGTTVIMATHQLDDLERIVDGLTVMYQSRVVAAGKLEDFKARLKRIQVVLPDGLPDTLQESTGIVEMKQQGQLISLMVDEHYDAIVEKLRHCQPVYMETMDLGLDDLFRHILKKEGYTRDGILLS